MEFDGDGVFALNIEERMTLCNMAIEAGGKNGIIAPDQVTLDYVNDRGKKTGSKPYTVMKSDAGAKFIFEKVYDVTKMEPVIAKPHSPDNKANVSRGAGARSSTAPTSAVAPAASSPTSAPRPGSCKGKDGEDRHVRRAGHDAKSPAG